MKKIIISILLACMVIPAYQVSANVKLATLINGEGKKIVVPVGSTIPSGYKLYSPAKIGAANINNFQSVTVSATTTIAGTASVVLAKNGGRKFAVITNTSGTIAYLAFNGTANPNASTTLVSSNDYVIPLAASGGSYTINLDNLYTGQVLASSSAAVAIRAFEANY